MGNASDHIARIVASNDAVLSRDRHLPRRNAEFDRGLAASVRAASATGYCRNDVDGATADLLRKLEAFVEPKPDPTPISLAPVLEPRGYTAPSVGRIEAPERLTEPADPSPSIKAEQSSIRISSDAGTPGASSVGPATSIWPAVVERLMIAAAMLIAVGSFTFGNLPSPRLTTTYDASAEAAPSVPSVPAQSNQPETSPAPSGAKPNLEDLPHSGGAVESTTLAPPPEVPVSPIGGGLQSATIPDWIGQPSGAGVRCVGCDRRASSKTTSARHRHSARRARPAQSAWTVWSSPF